MLKFFFKFNIRELNNLFYFFITQEVFFEINKILTYRFRKIFPLRKKIFPIHLLNHNLNKRKFQGSNSKDIINVILRIY